MDLKERKKYCFIRVKCKLLSIKGQIYKQVSSYSLILIKIPHIFTLPMLQLDSVIRPKVEQLTFLGE